VGVADSEAESPAFEPPGVFLRDREFTLNSAHERVAPREALDDLFIVVERLELHPHRNERVGADQQGVGRPDVVAALLRIVLLEPDLDQIASGGGTALG